MTTASRKIVKNNSQTESFHFRLPKELMKTISQWAEQENRSAKRQVEWLLRRGIAQWYKEQA